MKFFRNLFFIFAILLSSVTWTSEAVSLPESSDEAELENLRRQINGEQISRETQEDSPAPVTSLPSKTQPILQPSMPEQDFNFFKSGDTTDAFGEKLPDNEKNSKIKSGQGLADTFLEDKSKKDNLSISIPDVSGTWMEKLKTSNPLSSDDDNVSLENLVSNSQGRAGRSNASVFDISGIMLRMSLPQVEMAMQKRGFKKTVQKYEVPNFIKWRNEEKCRMNGVVGYERLASCVVDMAKAQNHQYAETVKFTKYDTQESIEIKFTSNFTNNKVYRVMYQSLSGTITGNSAKAQYLRNLKIFDFWKKINQKYGEPDNKDEVLWGMGGNKPYLHAASGFLVLEDPMLRELDYTRMSREDQKFINTDIYNF